MIVIELIRATRPGEAELAARVCADRDQLSVDGPEPGLIDPSQPVLSLRDGRMITCDDDPEEWVRGLAASFRTPYLSACVVVTPAGQYCTRTGRRKVHHSPRR